MRSVNEVIVHCTATNRPGYTLDRIREDHLNRGFNDVGYHFFIPYDGKLEFGRSIEKAGAHCRGRNAYSIGVALAGLDVFSRAQMETLGNLCKMLMWTFGLTKDDIKPHNFYNKNKTCPVFDVDKFKEDYL